MSHDKQHPDPIEVVSPHMAALDLPARISAACINIYRRTFRLLPFNHYLLEASSEAESDSDTPQKAPERVTNEPNSKHTHIGALERASCTLFKDMVATTFTLAYQDKTIFSFKIKDNRIATAFISISLPLAISLCWGTLALANTYLLKGIDFRAEVLVLVLVSIIPFFKAAHVSARNLASLLTIFALLDAVSWGILSFLYPHLSTPWKVTLFDFFLFGNTLSYIQGFSLGTLAWGCGLTACNYALRIYSAITWNPWVPLVHAMGHAAYLGLGEAVVQIISFKNCTYIDPIFTPDKEQMIDSFLSFGSERKAARSLFDT